jgi:hypothetical protein
LINGFTPSSGDLFFIIINDGSDAIQGSFSQGAMTGFAGTLFEISYSGDSQANTFTGGNDVVLRAVPEPATAVLALSGAALPLFRRRKGAAASA